MMAYKERAQQMSEKSTPAEIQALDARIERLHERLSAGDSDLQPDELQLAIDAAQRKRVSSPMPSLKHVIP
jgi:predicted  nucleic acid-binding Zn-ribbon protein